MPYRIVLITYLYEVNPIWKAHILTQLKTVEIEGLLLDEILSKSEINSLWERVTYEPILNQDVYISMLERLYLARKDCIYHVCNQELVC